MWWETNSTYIWLFNTGRGLSVVIRLPHNVGIIYDLGCSEEFSPLTFISKNIIPHLSIDNGGPIAQAVLSHPHQDHIQEIDWLLDTSQFDDHIHPGLLTCPNDIEPDPLSIDINRIENEDNKELIQKYCRTYKERHPPLQTINYTSQDYPANNVEYGIYYLNPKRVSEIHRSDNHAYVNALSLILYLRHGENSILIPGDITPEVFAEVISGGQNVQKRYTYFGNKPSGMGDALYRETGNQRNLKTLLNIRGLKFFVTPHHGLESCFCPDLYNEIQNHKTQINIISEKRHISDSDGIVDSRYQSASFSNGMNIDIDGRKENHFSISTRDGYHILMIFQDSVITPQVFLRKDPLELLEIE